MNVNVDDLIRKQYLLPAQITDNDVHDAVLNEDIKKIIPLDQDRKVIYFLKNKNDYYLLVDGRWSSPNLLISAVFKILPATIEETGLNNPLEVLQKLAEECGYEIQIGDRKSKFILDATVAIPRIHSEDQLAQIMSRLIKIPDWERRSDDVALQDSLMKWRQGDSHDYVDIALAYAISTNKYLRYLSG